MKTICPRSWAPSRREGGRLSRLDGWSLERDVAAEVDQDDVRAAVPKPRSTEMRAPYLRPSVSAAQGLGDVAAVVLEAAAQFRTNQLLGASEADGGAQPAGRAGEVDAAVGLLHGVQGHRAGEVAVNADVVTGARPGCCLPRGRLRTGTGSSPPPDPRPRAGVATRRTSLSRGQGACEARRAGGARVAGLAASVLTERG